MRKDLDGLYLAVFREGNKVSVCVDYSHYIAEDKKGDGMTGETRKRSPDKGLPTRQEVYLVDNNFTRFAVSGQESDYIVRSILNVLQETARNSDNARSTKLYFQEEEKRACSGAVYMFGLLSSTGVPASYSYPDPPDDRLWLDAINFEDSSIKARDEQYNLKAILLKTGDELQETMGQSGVRLWTNLNASSSYKYDVCNDISQKYIRPLPEERGGKPQQGSSEFPKEIDTDKGRELISKAQEAGFISCDKGKFKWERTKVLLAYFAMKATEYLNLPSRETDNGTTICLSPFEVLFQKNNLKASVNAERQRNGGDFLPKGYIEVNALFDSTE